MTALTTEARELLIDAFRGTSGPLTWSVYQQAWSAADGDWASATLIVGGAGMRVYDTVPTIPTPPAIVIIPGSPWLLPGRIGSNLNYEARWKILIVIKKRQNAAETIETENAVDTVLDLIPNAFQVVAVNAPQLNDIGSQGTVITTEIDVSIQMKES